MDNKCVCKYCGKQFKKKGVHIHEKVCEQNPDYNEHTKDFLKENARKTNIIQRYKSISLKNNYVFICQKCGKQYTLELTESQYKSGKYRKFCSRSCANSRKHTSETKDKISKALCDKSNNTLRIDRYTYICKYCGKKYTYEKNINSKSFCCKECRNKYIKEHKLPLSSDTINKLREAGKHSAFIQSEMRRSKNEIEFCNLCENYFSNVLHNTPMFNGWDADIILMNEKIAILWNGPWHYVKITKNHSVKQVQNRDNIKIKEIEKVGFMPYIIKDMGKYNKQFVTEEFEKFLRHISKS